MEEGTVSMSGMLSDMVAIRHFPCCMSPQTLGARHRLCSSRGKGEGSDRVWFLLR